MIAMDDHTLMSLAMAAVPLALYAGVLIGAKIQEMLRSAADKVKCGERLSAFPKNSLKFKGGDAKEGDFYFVLKGDSVVAYILRGNYWVEEPRIPVPQDAKPMGDLVAGPPPVPPLRTFREGLFGTIGETEASVQARGEYHAARSKWAASREAAARISASINPNIIGK